MKTINYPLSVNVYRNANSSCDCSANGLTARFNHLYLFVDMEDNAIVEYCESHNIKVENVLVLNRRILWGEKHYYAEPFVKREGNQMFGGNFVYTCDSRFSECIQSCPLPVHDRFESWN